MRTTRLPAHCGGILNPVRRAALIAFSLHLVAAFAMLFVLRHGLETTPRLHDRLAFLVNHRPSWTLAWLAWTAAALAILHFYVMFANAYRFASRFAVHLTVVAVAADLSAQAIEIGVLPSLAIHVFSRNDSPDLFLTMHRVAVMLSGYLANGLYSATALILVSSARRAYPVWVSSSGFAVGIFGIALSIAALLDSATGMLWTNVFLVPTILLWLAGVFFYYRKNSEQSTLA